MSEWIPVDAALPKIGHGVLAFIGGEGIVLAARIYGPDDTEKWKVFWTPKDYGAEASWDESAARITHWMVLPAWPINGKDPAHD